MNYDIGSMWRRWDLHIHSPFSVLNNQFGNDFDNYFYNLFKKAVDKKIAVIGITDYFSIEGYKKVIEYLNNEIKLKELFSTEIENDNNYINKVKRITVFPNIELRLDNMIDYQDKNKQSKLQIHVIFSNEVKVSEIEIQFLNSIHFKNGKNEYPLQKAFIEEYGKNLVEAGVAVGSNNNPLFVGYNGIAVNLNEVSKVLNESFYGKYLIVGVTEDITNINWISQAGTIRKNYFEICDAVFSSNSKTINWLASSDSLDTIGKNKACLWGSDAHSIVELFNPANNNYCWIKADTTFSGLKAAINTINERIYIGNVPDELSEARIRAPYSVASIYVGPNSNKQLGKKWFNFEKEIALNPFMITIIGNKGSGKSALADIISYLGNSYKLGSASFLNEHRFLNPKTKYNNDFKAYILMYDKDNSRIEKNVLSNDFDIEKPEMVQFLPQKYIEDVCNDLGEEFQEEIDKVIYSYIRPENKFDSKDLKDLIFKLSYTISSNISKIVSDLEIVNSKIINLEDRNSISYKQKMRNQLVLQTERLKNHNSIKPEEVKKPTDLETDFYSNLDYKLANYIEELNDKIVKAQDEQKNILIKISKIDSTFNSINSIKTNIDNINLEYENIKNELSINDDKQLFNYRINNEKLLEFKEVLLKENLNFNMLLNDNYDKDKVKGKVPSQIDNYQEIINKTNEFGSLYEKIYFIQLCKVNLNNFTSEKTKKYLDYVNNFNKWNNMKKMILGEIPNDIDGESIKKYKDEINYIETQLSNDLDKLKSQRKELITEICHEYDNLREIYVNIYNPIQQKIDSILNDDDEKIQFSVSTTPVKNLASKLISYMNLRVSSEFKGVSEGLEKIESLIKETDFDDSVSVVDFVSKIFDDISKAKDLNAFISDRKSLYNYLGSLTYLNVNYSLTLGGKKLTELSPGERGIVLLVFYLALSQSNFPLIIDQPEDNLDNQSVYKRLVPCIKAAKKNRQIIVVTHNPNIAVACDSEQIIFTKMDKDNFEIKYETGSLENPSIKSKVIDILEGTMPAFDKRRLSYFDELS